jgi:rSAM/selenodomain-associated transferase 2
MSTDQKTSNISIIIPTRNEADSIGRLLPELLALPGVELLVVDGGSTDNTVDVAKSLGAQVLSTSPGKAKQMNAGAEAAHGNILLFLHCDTKPAPGFVEQVRDALNQPGVSAGAFRLSIDGKGFGLRVIEWLVNFRSQALQMPYGDQGFFVTTDMFFSVGAFPPLPIMEDFELIRKLKKQGKVTILPLHATTSSRRWERLGILKTTAINQAIIIGYLFGVSPEKLAGLYRRLKAKG